MLPKVILSVFVLSFLAAGGGLAEERRDGHRDKNLIYVEGQAKNAVEVNAFHVNLDFDLEKGSFDETRQSSQKVVDKIKANVDALGFKSVQYIQGWDLLRQAGISLSSKGKKVSNRLTIEVADFPQGRLFDAMAKVVDAGIGADPAVTVTSVNVFLTDDLESKTRQQSLKEALSDLNQNAVQAAGALGRTIQSPKQIFTTNEQNLEQGQEGLRDVHSWSSFSDSKMKGIVSFQKSFKVDAQISEQINVVARVAGYFELN